MNTTTACKDLARPCKFPIWLHYGPRVETRLLALTLTKVASGDITVPPDVLIKIARRAQSDMTNLDMQAPGRAAICRQRFGDNNMKAYQQAWNANADSKIFEAINLTRQITDPALLTKELNKLFPTPAKHA